ncbi:tyrosine-type recombinase/integrase [Photobacterium carnosum]|uniref:site-specific integrase n=1 Tax=Photobacterium carnosum TaxID=2023717 RepID=UPI001E4F2231|nr:site-specific integrase [Photobacterium carnosum]MCD9550659.1 tyrosine-type recombinase/integrase [Photobacterium carnosum]MCF2307777.1 tyrosine-type recombinase/integrase [Photobacterium carnosum]
MKKKFKFTTTNLKSLPCNPIDSPSTELEFSDTDVTGLKCLSGKTGSKRFLLRYQINGKKTSIAIGRFPDVDLSTARKIARQYKSEVAQGSDPKKARELSQKMPTIGDFFNNTYLPLAQKRKRTWKDDVQRFSYHCNSISFLRYDELTANLVMQIQLSMNTATKHRNAYAPATCNRVIALLKTMGKLASQLLDIQNVAERVALLPEDNARTRYCDVRETKQIIHAALSYHCKSSGSFIALLFLMGCRESELRLRKWADIDLDNKVMRIPRTKNGSYHIVYLSELMLDILNNIPKVTNNPYVFPGQKIGKPIYRPYYAFEVIKQRANVDNPDEVVFHTARHSVASNLISNGMDISSVQKLLNHRSIESTLRYAKLSEGKQRETSQRLSNLITDYNPLDNNK